MPPHSEFYEAVTGAVRRDEVEDSEADWATPEEDEATLAGTTGSGAPPPPLAAQTGEFGTLDEPPSLVSSISGQGMARVPSFDLGDASALPGGAFGEVRDLSLISTSGISGISSGGLPTDSEYDTNEQPAPVLSMKGAPPPSMPEVPFGPMTEFTPRPVQSPVVPSKAPPKTAPLAARKDPRAEPLDPKKTTDPYGPFAPNRTSPMAGVPTTAQGQNPHKSTDPMGGAPKPHRTTDPMGGRPHGATQPLLAANAPPPQAVIPTSRPPALPTQQVPADAFRSSPPPAATVANAPPLGMGVGVGAGVGAGGGASAFAGASGAYPAAGSGPFPAQQSGGFPAVTPDYPMQHAQIHAPSGGPPPLPGHGSTQPVMSHLGQGMGSPMGQGMPMQPPMGQGMPMQPPMGQGMPMGQMGMPMPHMPMQPPMGMPVLVDVTPRALVVETAGGFCDTVIPRNAKIPCERTRKFSTGRDMQTTVRVRVGQGENPVFAQNTFLGEVELSGLRPAGRGEVTVAVTFELDADGTLKVRAADGQTGHEARATLRLLGVADEESVVDMIQRMGDPMPNMRV